MKNHQMITSINQLRFNDSSSTVTLSRNNIRSFGCRIPNLHIFFYPCSTTNLSLSVLKKTSNQLTVCIHLALNLFN